MSGTPTSIYGLTGAWLELLETNSRGYNLEDGECFTDEEMAAQFDALAGSVEDKVAGCGFVLRRMEGDAALVGVEVKRLKARQDAIEKGREGLAERLRGLMTLTDTAKVETPTITVTMSKPLKKVQVFGEVPAEYMTQPVAPEPKPMLKELAKALKDGDIPGARLVDGQRRLAIK